MGDIHHDADTYWSIPASNLVHTVHDVLDSQNTGRMRILLTRAPAPQAATHHREQGYSRCNISPTLELATTASLVTAAPRHEIAGPMRQSGSPTAGKTGMAPRSCKYHPILPLVALQPPPSAILHFPSPSLAVPPSPSLPSSCPPPLSIVVPPSPLVVLPPHTPR
ncbi:hypothetical protein C8J57DRAFT_1503558 [Mycena rebaudengoi]|nr:hypothetical protein C8J57DRAFT_1503558 [Mycena rebaudengoi]